MNSQLFRGVSPRTPLNYYFSTVTCQSSCIFFFLHSLSKNIFCLLYSLSKIKSHGCSSFQQISTPERNRQKKDISTVRKSLFVGCVLVDVRIFFRSRPNNIFFCSRRNDFFLPRAFFSLPPKSFCIFLWVVFIFFFAPRLKNEKRNEFTYNSFLMLSW